MESKMSARVSGYLSLLAIGFLMFFSSSVIKAQNTSVKCEWKWTWDWEWVTEDQYNSSTGRYEPQQTRRYERRYRYVCEPTPPKANSNSKDKNSDSSDSNTVRDAEIKASPGLRPPYAGQYIGKWVTTFSDVGEQKGEWTLSLDADGKITGKEVNTTFDVTADISGFVNDKGQIELTFKYGGIFKDAPPALMKGSITNVENHRLKGILKQYRGEKVTTVIEIDLAPIGAK